MSFEWPELLWLLALVPAAVLAWRLAVRRRRRTRQVQLPGLLAAIGRDTGAGARLHSWLPALLLGAALVALLLALARPNAVLTLPAPHDTVILAIDISGSMRADDVAPSRIEAAQAAARAFVERQPARTRIGVVAFAAAAAQVQAPTHDRRAILAALERLQLQQATAIGSGLLVALKAIEPSLPIDLRGLDPRGDPRGDPQRWPEPVAPGSNGAAAIVLLSDGQSVTGPDPLVAAQLVAERGVRVHTVGLGTPAGAVLSVQGWSMRVRLDEEALRKIADLTLGGYYPAADAGELERVYRTLGLRLAFERQRMEVTSLFAGVGALLLTLSAGLSLWWFRRVF